MAQGVQRRGQPLWARNPGAGGVWARVANLILGVWLVSSAFLWPHTPALRTNTAVVGALISLVALLALSEPILRGFNLALAFWLALSTLVMWRATELTLWNNLLVAAGVLLFAFTPSRRRLRAA